jgi:hypothetical protein
MAIVEEPQKAKKTATKSKPKDKKEKYWQAPEVEQLGRTIVTNCNGMFHYINLADFVFLFKKAKERADKNIKMRIIKEPISLVSSKKVMVFVGNEWWDNNIDSDRTKALIESFLSITGSGNEGDHYEKRDYDVQTFNELLQTPQLDYSKFTSVLPAEAKAPVAKSPENLVLTAE